VTVARDSEWLDALLRTLEYAKDLRKQREASSSAGLTCFRGVSSELSFRVLQVLGHHGVVPTGMCCRRIRSVCLSLRRTGGPTMS
jgi:aspartate kinase